jgi:hypothetical protein
LKHVDPSADCRALQDIADQIALPNAPMTLMAGIAAQYIGEHHHAGEYARVTLQKNLNPIKQCHAYISLGSLLILYCQASERAHL